jgi:hypothetical protein
MCKRGRPAQVLKARHRGSGEVFAVKVNTAFLILPVPRPEAGLLEPGLSRDPRLRGPKTPEAGPGFRGAAPAVRPSCRRAWSRYPSCVVT